MCGIAGIISTDPNRVRDALPRMTGAMVHRGPDDSGIEVLPLGGATLGLGFRRLAIQDLSAAGHQPMRHPHTGDAIIFNGEIYNAYELRDELLAAGEVFRGHSDTEILLHALTRYGPQTINRLAGMYAFAFYNAQEQRLLLCRDPLGIKPLYVAYAPGVMLFASEVRPILASGLVASAIDPAAVAGFLAYGSVQEPLTIFKEVQAFPPGCWQQLDARVLDGQQRPQPRRYWNVPPPDPAATQPAAEKRVQSLLETSIRDHLISDVPVGVFLSAGFDSTITAGLAVRHTSKLRTFTVGFADNPDLSEGDLAAQTARQIGAEHTDIQILGKDAEAALAPWLAAMDQPSIDGINTYIISKAVRQAGIIVALSGLGGDELFAGYDSFTRVPSMLSTFRKVGWLPAWGRSALSTVATLGKPAAVAGKALDIARSDGSLLSLYLQTRRTMSNRQLAELGVDAAGLDLDATFMPPAALDAVTADESDPVWSVSQLESRLYMNNTLLRDSDANGMAHSLEIRVPFLDRRVIDYVLALPGNLRRPPGSVYKHLLRRCFGGLLRPALLDRKKSGFSLPIGRWLVGPLREFCEESISHLKSLGLLRPQGIGQVWNGFVAGGDTTRWSRAFSLCVLGAYLRAQTRRHDGIVRR
ncbi:Asparagine synthetase [glutamine-hydrolyzing] 1 [Phycisphaerae bacterium RAS1]|nr:Asparagine synthetase [glutamine-hydrolyzing] 1 [Phycisphaerae bacterium RAS1]